MSRKQPTQEELQKQLTEVYTTSLEFYDWIMLRSDLKDIRQYGPFKRFEKLFRE